MKLLTPVAMLLNKHGAKSSGRLGFPGPFPLAQALCGPQRKEKNPMRETPDTSLEPWHLVEVVILLQSVWALLSGLQGVKIIASSHNLRCRLYNSCFWFCRI